MPECNSATPPKLADPMNAMFEQAGRARRLAEWYVVSDIELSCPLAQTSEDATFWYDTRPMLDEREHSPEFIDMSTEALTYALEAKLFVQHATQPHLVRYVRRHAG